MNNKHYVKTWLVAAMNTNIILQQKTICGQMDVKVLHKVMEKVIEETANRIMEIKKIPSPSTN